MASEIELYLIRHGLAGESGSYPDDDQRPLTEEGKKKTRQVAKRLSNLGLQFDLILTSPLVRARQTAEILMDLELSKQLESEDSLADGNINRWLEWFQSWEPGKHQQLALVGHEPSLSQWAEQLIWGKPKGAIEFKKAGVLGLKVPVAGSPIGHSTLFWLTPPRFLIDD
ncbi:MAG: phosphohistidine phosphatase SixA [Oscillatoriales cyanobacterium C42_A2020_001]|nr:phosphohistidine phosphatase SixA [Leptolyngbyaceae cyanobacterium C42_A2020_001]